MGIGAENMLQNFITASVLLSSLVLLKSMSFVKSLIFIFWIKEYFVSTTGIEDLLQQNCSAFSFIVFKILKQKQTDFVSYLL